MKRLETPAERQAAFSIEQMAPSGVERPGAGVIRESDLAHAEQRVDALLKRPRGTPRDESKRRSLEGLRDKIGHFRQILTDEQADGLVYIAERELALPSRLKSAAIEIDFCFGDRDGAVSIADLQEARKRYGEVRGPVGWNRLLTTDEVERHLFPERTLRSTDGLRLLPEDWLCDGPEPLARLKKVVEHVDDHAVARTYADIAARLATLVERDPTSRLGRIFEDALVMLGAEIRGRNGVRPTITDIARIGCEVPEVKALLSTPIEMSRKLRPAALLDRYLAS